MEYVAFKCLQANPRGGLSSPVHKARWKKADGTFRLSTDHEDLDHGNGIFAGTWAAAARYGDDLYMVVPYFPGDPATDFVLADAGWRSTRATVIAGPYHKAETNGTMPVDAAETILAYAGSGYRQIPALLGEAKLVCGADPLRVLEDLLNAPEELAGAMGALLDGRGLLRQDAARFLLDARRSGRAVPDDALGAAVGSLGWDADSLLELDSERSGEVAWDVLIRLFGEMPADCARRVLELHTACGRGLRWLLTVAVRTLGLSADTLRAVLDRPEVVAELVSLNEEQPSAKDRELARVILEGEEQGCHQPEGIICQAVNALGRSAWALGVLYANPAAAREDIMLRRAKSLPLPAKEGELILRSFPNQDRIVLAEAAQAVGWTSEALAVLDAHPDVLAQALYDFAAEGEPVPEPLAAHVAAARRAGKPLSAGVLAYMGAIAGWDAGVLGDLLSSPADVAAFSWCARQATGQPMPEEIARMLVEASLDGQTQRLIVLSEAVRALGAGPELIRRAEGTSAYPAFVSAVLSNCADADSWAAAAEALDGEEPLLKAVRALADHLYLWTDRRRLARAADWATRLSQAARERLIAAVLDAPSGMDQNGTRALYALALSPQVLRSRSATSQYRPRTGGLLPLSRELRGRLLGWALEYGELPFAMGAGASWAANDAEISLGEAFRRAGRGDENGDWARGNGALADGWRRVSGLNTLDYLGALAAWPFDWLTGDIAEGVVCWLEWAQRNPQCYGTARRAFRKMQFITRAWCARARAGEALPAELAPFARVLGEEEELARQLSLGF